jgi:hypothetical protein
MRSRRAGSNSASNQGLRLSHRLLRGLGCGIGTMRGQWVARRERSQSRSRPAPAGGKPVVLTDGQREFKAWQLRQQAFPPGRRAFWPWRQVTRLAGPGVAQAHGYDGHLAGVIKHLASTPHPGSQPVSADIVKGQSRFMDFSPGRLGRNQQTRRRAELEHRTRAQRQTRGAQGAGADLTQ